eukprot:scaffold20698_cov111-Isochrysis_galbana.AAC.3
MLFEKENKQNKQIIQQSNNPTRRHRPAPLRRCAAAARKGSGTQPTTRSSNWGACSGSGLRQAMHARAAPCKPETVAAPPSPARLRHGGTACTSRRRR